MCRWQLYSMLFCDLTIYREAIFVISNSQSSSLACSNLCMNDTLDMFHQSGDILQGLWYEDMIGSGYEKKYRVTIQVVPNLRLKSKQKLRFSISPLQGIFPLCRKVWKMTFWKVPSVCMGSM